MKIVVCIKQVPDTDEVKIDEEKGTLIRKGVPSIINPEDRNALEEAVKIKEKNGAEIVVITMGPPQAKEALREAYAIGADQVILLSDIAFAGSDTWATAYTLSQAIKEIGNVDLILCGRQAIDGDTAQVGPQIAENLSLPQLTYVKSLDINSDKISVSRAIEAGSMELETKLPALVTVLGSVNQPRYPSIKRIIEIYNQDKIVNWSKDDLDLDESKLGLDASPTQVADTFVPTHEKKGEIYDSKTQSAVKLLVNNLKLEKVI